MVTASREVTYKRDTSKVCRKTFSCGRCKLIPRGAHFTSLWNIHLIQQWMLSTAITQSDLCPRSWYQAFSERITGALSPGRAVLLEISSGRSRLSGSCYKRSTVKQENIWWHSTSSSSSSSSSSSPTVSYGALHPAISKLCGQLTAANTTNSIKSDSNVSSEIRTPVSSSPSWITISRLMVASNVDSQETFTDLCCIS